MRRGGIFPAFELMGILTAIAAQVIPSTTIELSLIAAATSSGVPPVCCFVIQDTVTEEWWQQYSTSIFSGVVNVTSITTLNTPYPTTTLTNYETNVYLMNTISAYTNTVGGNPLQLLNKFVQGPVESTSVLYPQNGTQIVTVGVTVASPTAFNVYTTVKIITVPAVTDSSGSVTCVTLSEFSISILMTADPSPTTVTLGPFFYSGINSNAEAYFGGVSLPGAPTISISQPTGVIISLTTPFIYTPMSGATGAPSTIGLDKFCSPTDALGASEAYGWVPQTLVDFLRSNPYYTSRYPGLESCLPGGPTIVPFSYCPTVEVLPTTVNALTRSTVITVLPTAFADQNNVTLPVNSSVSLTSSTTKALNTSVPFPISGNLSTTLGQSASLGRGPSANLSATAYSGPPMISTSTRNVAFKSWCIIATLGLMMALCSGFTLL